MGCSVDLFAPHVLAVCGAAIGLSRFVRLRGFGPRIDHGWHEFPIMWVGTVAESGTLKSPAFDHVKAPLVALERSFIPGNREAEKQYKLLHQIWEKAYSIWKRTEDSKEMPPEEPHRPRRLQIVAEDITIEKLGSVLNDNARGIGILASELVGFFGRIGRYSKQGTTKYAELSQWLELHRGGHIFVDRVNGTRISIPRAGVTIAGTIQPGALKRVIGTEYIENGLAARFLFVWPPEGPPPQWQTKNVDIEVVDAYHDTVTSLYEQIEMRYVQPWMRKRDPTRPEYEPQIVKLSKEARALWRDFYNRHKVRIYECDRLDIRAAFSKIEAYAARIALILHLVRYVNGEVEDEKVLDEDSLSRGTQIADWWCSEIDRIYRKLYKRPAPASSNNKDLPPDQRRVLDWITNTRREKVTVRQVTQHINGMNKATAEAALKGLADAGYGTIEYTKRSMVFRLTLHPTPNTKAVSSPSGRFVTGPKAKAA